MRKSEIRFCSSCGAKLAVVNANYCSMCGHKTESSDDYSSKEKESSNKENDYIVSDTVVNGRGRLSCAKCGAELSLLNKYRCPSCGNMIRKTNKESKRLSDKTYNAIIVFAIIGIIALAIFFITTDWQLVSDKREAASFNASPEMIELADSLPLTEKGRAILFASHPHLLSRSEYNAGCGALNKSDYTVSGCYYSKEDYDEEKIEIYHIEEVNVDENMTVYDFKDSMIITTLHEMLHAAYERLSEEKRASVCERLNIVAPQIPDFNSELSSYSSDSRCSEMFARYGSSYGLNMSCSLCVSSQKQRKDLDSTGLDAALYLKDIYSDYYYSTFNLLHFWSDNEENLSNLSATIKAWSLRLDQQYDELQARKRDYYAYPSNYKYRSINAAINEYNGQVEAYNSYIGTYNKITHALNSKYYKIGDNYNYFSL